MAKIIKSLRVKNFRGIKDLQIHFDHLNIFIGNNGTNKTNILEAINSMHFRLHFCQVKLILLIFTKELMTQ